MKKIVLGGAFLFGILSVVYMMGPTPPETELNGVLPDMGSDLRALEQRIVAGEKENALIKPDNEARIIWADSAFQQTPFSIVYLHGFGASQAEGAPLHTLLAKKYGCNLYLSRLKEQGISSDSAFKSMTAENYLASAREAVAIGKVIGEKVIIMGTSTGGALGLYITAHNPDVAGLVLYSPIIEARNAQLGVLTMPWGTHLMEWVVGNDHIVEEREGLDKQYWSRVYYIQGYTALSVLVDQTMQEETFQQVQCPVFLGYYYKNEEEQDEVVSVPAMLEMFEQLGTPASLKRKQAFPEAGDHVIASYIRSEAWEDVMHATDRFLSEVMHLQPVNTTVSDTLSLKQSKK